MRMVSEEPLVTKKSCGLLVIVKLSTVFKKADILSAQLSMNIWSKKGTSVGLLLTTRLQQFSTKVDMLSVRM